MHIRNRARVAAALTFTICAVGAIGVSPAMAGSEFFCVGYTLNPGSYCNSDHHNDWHEVRANSTSGSVCVKSFYYPSGSDYGSYLCNNYLYGYAYHCYNGTNHAYGRARNDGSYSDLYAGEVFYFNESSSLCP